MAFFDVYYMLLGVPSNRETSVVDWQAIFCKHAYILSDSYSRSTKDLQSWLVTGLYRRKRADL